MAPAMQSAAVDSMANVLFVTFDCLRYDVAQRGWAEGVTPCLAGLLPATGWEPRDTPGTFTLPAHLAFFHGFLPTPRTPGPHPRLWALEFEGSLTIGPRTRVFGGVDNVIAGFRADGYRTMCVGGVGFFNKRNPLGCVLPGFFEESVWSPAMGVTARDSTARQVAAAVGWLAGLRAGEKAFLFINVSATHPPHAMYVPGAVAEGVETQLAALRYADGCLPPLLAALRGRWLCLLMGDHGEAYGEDGRWGHRIAHPVVTTVPYAEGMVERSGEGSA